MKSPAQFMHEMRTAIGNITNLTGIAKDEGYKVENYKETIDFISVIGLALMEVIYYYTERYNSPNPEAPIIVDVDVRDLLKTLLADTQQNQKLVRQITISEYIDENVSETVRTDKILLTEILRNLIENALKFSRDKGEVFIIISSTPETLSIVVQDHGYGMSESILENIFEPTTYVSSYRFRGMGVGLAILKDNIDALGGTVKVKSEEGKGSTFTVDLPI